MFRYRVSYRNYTLCKGGIGLAYLWYVSDFLRIHLAAWAHPSRLLLNPAGMTFVGSSYFDPILREYAELLNGKAAVWTFVAISPVAVGLYLWGRRRWLQLGVGAWMSFSMIGLCSLSGDFASSADLWLHYDILAYTLAALTVRGNEWSDYEPGVSRAAWRKNATVGSLYAALLVCVQFAVYVFAGVNKLVFGWAPWTSGTALQNLAFDSSVHDFVRGTHVPYAVSLVLCYVTLFQRLVVPFGFFWSKSRLWSALILGVMHVIYAVLMSVNLFPVVGLSSLLLVWPPRATSVSTPKHPSRSTGLRTPLRRDARTRLQILAVGLFVSWLLLEPIRLTASGAMPWENKLMVVPAWRMFADGGVAAGGAWRLLFLTRHGKVDVTEMSLESLPHLWRDRFLVDMIFHELATNDVGPNSLTRSLLLTTEETYRLRERQRGADPMVLRPSFDLYFKK
jgi:vitamin K-dependent gamma-carboxylase-like protein